MKAKTQNTKINNLLKDYKNFWSNDNEECKRPFTYFMLTNTTICIITLTILTSI
jgi:hypothetical protein